MATTNLSAIEKKTLQKIMNDPVLWARSFVVNYDKETKKNIPWTPRWYQKNMLQDKSLKRVARCGRRTGKEIAVLF